MSQNTSYYALQLFPLKYVPSSTKLYVDISKVQSDFSVERETVLSTVASMFFWDGHLQKDDHSAESGAV